MIKQFTWVTGGRIGAALIQAAMLILAALVLAPSGFGELSAALALAVLPQTIADFGITTFVLRQRAADRADARIGEALWINDRASAVAGALYALAVLLYSAAMGHEYLALLPLAIWLATEKNADVWSSVLIADRDARMNVALLVLRRGLALGLFLGLVASHVDAVLAFTSSYAIASSIGASLTHVVVKRRIAARTQLGVRALLRSTGPYWVHTMATQARNLDTAIVAWIGGPFQAGLYAVASRLTNPLRILPTSLVAVAIPHIASSGGVVERKLRWLLGAVLVGMSAIYISIVLLAPWAVPAVLGDEYSPAVVPVQIVCIGLIFGAAASLTAGVLQAKGRQRLVGRASASTSAYCVGSIVLLSNLYGATGAALALASSFFFQTVFMLIGSRCKVSRRD